MDNYTKEKDDLKNEIEQKKIDLNNKYSLIENLKKEFIEVVEKYEKIKKEYEEKQKEDEEKKEKELL